MSYTDSLVGPPQPDMYEYQIALIVGDQNKLPEAPRCQIEKSFTYRITKFCCLSYDVH